MKTIKNQCQFYLKLRKVICSQLKKIINYHYIVSIVKTPTTTSIQLNTTTIDVGFDMIMTVQTTHHHRNSTLALERDQCSENKPNLRQSSQTILDNYPRLFQTILDYLRQLSLTILDYLRQLSLTILDYLRQLSLTILDYHRQLSQTILDYPRHISLTILDNYP